MSTDYSILEKELSNLKGKLERDLHMHQLKRLSKKQSDLAMNIVQRKQIENLTEKLDELQRTVTKLHCPHYALKDNEIKNYLVYLLKMKDFFSREVATKEEMIKQKHSQIKVMVRMLSSVVNDQAKLRKNIPAKSPEYIRLENMSNRLNQMNKDVSIKRKENQQIMENIVNMKKFQTQFRKFEKDFKRKIHYQKEKAYELLEKAVTAYEEKEEFMSKERMLQERCAQDMRKVAINENALDLCLRKAEKNDEFTKLQNVERTDIRIAKTSEMVKKCITGLEPNMEKMQKLQSTISAAAREENPEKMGDEFKVDDDKIDMMFSYFGELLKDINHLEGNIVILKEENRDLIKNMRRRDRQLRKEVKYNQDTAQVKLESADEAEKAVEEAKTEFNTLLDFVRSLYVMYFPDHKESLEHKAIDDSSVIDCMENMEKQLLEYLLCLEYIRMKEASKEDQPLILETEEDEDRSDEIQKTEDLNIIQPRTLSSKCELQSLLELETEKTVMNFEELKEKAVAALDEIQSEKGGSENEDEDVN